MTTEDGMEPRWLLAKALAGLPLRGGCVAPSPAPERDRRFLAHAILGRSHKWIALSETVPRQTVSRRLAGMIERVGVGNPVQALFVLNRLRHAARLSRCSADDLVRLSFEEDPARDAGVSVANAHAPSEPALAVLTRAEREVLMLVLAGASNRQIARTRRTSDRTVANQIASVFRKLRVASRAELAVRVTQTSNVGYT